MAKTLKGYRIFIQIFKGLRDTWINFRDIGMQCFLNFGDICHMSQDMRVPTMWYAQPEKAQISLGIRAV